MVIGYMLLFILLDAMRLLSWVVGCWTYVGRTSYTELMTITGFIVDFLSTKVCFL